MNKRVAVSGCSSGGKSTLVSELGSRGYAIVEEPGRRIIAEERAVGGDALPWVNSEAFVRRAVEMSLRDLRENQKVDDWVFFDRGLVDAASALASLTADPVSALFEDHLPYFETAFFVPPWPEIYVNDAERRHSFGQAVEEYERLLAVYQTLGFEVVILPKTGVKERADFLQQHLAE